MGMSRHFLYISISWVNLRLHTQDCAGSAIRLCSQDELSHWRSGAVDSPLAPCWPDTALVMHLFLVYVVLLLMVQLGMT